MLPNGPANHLPLDGEGVHVAPGFSQPEVSLPARHAELDELVVPFDPDLANAAITVGSPSGGLFEIVAVLDIDLPASDSSGCLDVEFDPGADDPAPVARRNQADVWLVVRTRDRGRCHLDLLHQLALVRIHGIEPIDHVVLICVRRGIP